MPQVRPNAAAKWARRTASASTEYQEGVQNPRNDWKDATVAAAPVQAAAVQQAIQEKRFEKGVARAGTEKWKKGAINKGVVRFGPGVQAAEGDYQQGVAPYLETIQNTKLPPRGPKGDPRNIQRVAVLAKALNDKKKSLT